MNLVAILLCVGLVSQCYGVDHASVNIDKAMDGGENERVWVDLKRIDPKTHTLEEETSLQVNLHFHLKGGIVHLNGRPCHHSVPNAIHLSAQINEINYEDGSRVSGQEAVVVRVFVDTHLVNGKRVFTIEEEVIAVGHKEVTQVDVKQIVIESNDNVHEFKRSLLTLSVEESKLHAMTRDQDRHSGDLRPMLPDTPLYATNDDDDSEHAHDGHHHGNHHHGIAKISCWFHRLSLKSRICIFIVLCLLGVTVCLCCSLCCKRRKNRIVVKLMTDEDDVINDMTVDMEEVKVEDLDMKKKEGEEPKEEFHFEMEDDHKVDIDDKKQLLE